MSVKPIGSAEVLPDDPQAVTFAGEHVRAVADLLSQVDYAAARLLTIYSAKRDGSGATIQERLEAASGSLVIPDGGDQDGRGAISVADVAGVVGICQAIQAFMTADRRALIRRVAVNPQA